MISRTKFVMTKGEAKKEVVEKTVKSKVKTVVHSKRDLVKALLYSRTFEDSEPALQISDRAQQLRSCLSVFTGEWRTNMFRLINLITGENLGPIDIVDTFYKKGRAFVLLTNPNSHTYPLNTVIVCIQAPPSVSFERCVGMVLPEGSIRNCLPIQPDSRRLATKQEIDILLDSEVIVDRLYGEFGLDILEGIQI